MESILCIEARKTSIASLDALQSSNVIIVDTQHLKIAQLMSAR